MDSGGRPLPRDDRAASRSRSPARAAMAGNVHVRQAVPALLCCGVGHSMACPSEWDGNFDGRVWPFRHGFVLGVADALVDGPDRRRTIFMESFSGNQGFRGDRILVLCMRRHQHGRPWDHVVQFSDALREVALHEVRERSG